MLLMLNLGKRLLRQPECKCSCRPRWTGAELQCPQAPLRGHARRMKEWGKRYLQPCAEWFGFRFPDRIVRVSSRTGACQPFGQSSNG